MAFFGESLAPKKSEYTEEWIKKLKGEADGWIKNGSGWSACPTHTNTLESDFYDLETDNNNEVVFTPKEIETDDLYELPDPVSDTLMIEFSKFWESEGQFKKAGLSHKRGIMLHGPPGSGKTSLIHKMARVVIKEKLGVVIMAGGPELTSGALARFRKIHPNRPIICLYEDIDSLIEEYGESGYLSLLDGENQVSKIVNVATTNYPERIDPRFVNRPGRFDSIIYVGMPTEECRRIYVGKKIARLSAKKLEDLMDKSNGWSLAHLREYVVSTRVLKKPHDQVIDEINKMIEDLPTSENESRREIGFAIRQQG